MRNRIFDVIPFLMTLELITIIKQGCKATTEGTEVMFPVLCLC